MYTHRWKRIFGRFIPIKLESQLIHINFCLKLEQIAVLLVKAAAGGVTRL